MYDEMETELSSKYIEKLNEQCKDMNFAILGGWATFFYVNPEYRRAFGSDYLKSRDIDVFIAARDERKFAAVIKSMGFEKSSYFFRYKLICNRETASAVSEEAAKGMPIHDLIEVLLDVFSDRKTRTIGSWSMHLLKSAINRDMGGFRVIGIKTLLAMKCFSFFDREALDKEFKDACDIYALLNYSGKRMRLTKGIAKAIEKTIRRDDLCDFIASNVLQDPLKSSAVKATLKNLLGMR